MRSETLLLAIVNKPAGMKSERYFNTLDIHKYISFDLCEAYNRIGKFQSCSLIIDDLSFASVEID